MPAVRHAADSPTWSAVSWCLRWAISLQLIGSACQVLWPRWRASNFAGLFSLLHGAGFAGETAEQWSTLAGWLSLIAGLSLVGFPLLAASMRYASPGYIPTLPSMIWQSPILVLASAMMVFSAVAMRLYVPMRMGEWTLGERAVSIFAPLAYLWLLPRPGTRDISLTRRDDAVTLLRYAVAATFFSHGIKCLGQADAYRDLLISLGQRWLGWELPAPLLDSLLMLFGTLDIVAALLLILFRWRPVPLYLSAWGFVTAILPLCAYGAPGVADFLIRLGRGGVPLAVFLIWRDAKIARTASAASAR